MLSGRGRDRYGHTHCIAQRNTPLPDASPAQPIDTIGRARIDHDFFAVGKNKIVAYKELIQSNVTKLG
jgi:hypothetical protein